jgi:hypothetical protein
MYKWSLPFRASITLFVMLAFHLIHSESLLAQAEPTASKQSAYSFFGAYSLVDTDRDSEKNSGFTFGFDYTRYLPCCITPSLEIRVKIAPGDQVDENTFGGGLRLEHRLKDFHPYADFLWNYGRISFPHAPIPPPPEKPYKYDDSIVYSTGVGLDFDFTSQWAARVDYQFESWNLGPGSTFAPQILSFGVVYRILFRPYKVH